MRDVTTHTGARLPVVGQGTWEMGRRRDTRAAEAAALRLGFELGMTLVDTAEMYADGGAEAVVGDALAGWRDHVFLVSKVLPSNASRAGTRRAAERSLRRLRTDRIDLYLLHWAGEHPIEATLDAFALLQREGKIVHYGVSNFDVGAMEAAVAVSAGGGIAANQVYYNLAHRGIEHRLIPWCQARQIVVMAYSPLDQGRIPPRGALAAIARRHGVTPAQIALAWTMRDAGIVTIPKAATADHVRQNAAAATITLDASDLAALDGDYPPGAPDGPLATL